MDALLAFDGTLLQGDLSVAGADLATDDGLATAIVVSLFTDRRAEPDDRLPAGADDRRGWWGDHLADRDGDRIGSRLWLLSREKQLTDVLVRAEEYANEALAWLVEDKVASAVDVTAEVVRDGMLGLLVRVTRPAGEVAEYRYNHVWGAS